VDSRRSDEMADITDKLSSAITDASKPKARKKGKQQKHKLTMPVTRRVRPVKRKELNRPSILLKIHLAKDSEPKVIVTSDSPLASGKRSPSHDSASTNNTQHKRKSKQKENASLLGRERIFCASDHPETHVSVTDAASPKQPKRGKKRNSVQGNISFMLNICSRTHGNLASVILYAYMHEYTLLLLEISNYIDAFTYVLRTFAPFNILPSYLEL
jgi:hypothetical protein